MTIFTVLRMSLSHNNPCFPCNIAITNFLILYTCEIRFYDVIDRTVHTFTSWRHPMRKFQNMANFGPLFFNLIHFIQLCDKKNLTYVDCWDKISLNSSCKMLLSSPKARLISFSKTHLIDFISTVNSWQIIYFIELCPCFNLQFPLKIKQLPKSIRTCSC